MPQFMYPALFIIFSADKARFWEVSEAGAQEIGEQNEPADMPSDHEGFFGSRGSLGGVGGGEPDLYNAERNEAAHRHTRAVAKRAAAIWKTGIYHHLSGMATKKYFRLLSEALADHLPGVKSVILPGDFIHAEAHEIPALFHRTLEPQK